MYKEMFMDKMYLFKIRTGILPNYVVVQPKVWESLKKESNIYPEISIKKENGIESYMGVNIIEGHGGREPFYFFENK